MSEWKEIVTHFEAARGVMALATAVRTTGSTYRKAGARLLLDARGRLAGSITSGCVEDEIAGLARAVMAGGEASLHSFDLLPRYGCQGVIDVLIERVLPGDEFLAQAARALRTRTTWRAATVWSSRTRALGSRIVKGDAPPDDEALVQTVLPAIQLVVIGEGLENEALATMAGTLGWDFAVARTFGEVPSTDGRTAVVVKAQKFGRDLIALRSLLSLPIGYLGLMGPARRKQKLLNTLFDEGLLSPNATLSNLYGPSGLDVGADTPAEVALAIVAEVQAVLAGHSGGSLRDKREPLHQPVREVKEIKA